MQHDHTLPHVDGSGRGMDDGECIHCGVSGSLEGAECPVRLRAALDRLRDIATIAAAKLPATERSPFVRLIDSSRDCLARSLVLQEARDA